KKSAPDVHDSSAIVTRAVFFARHRTSVSSRLIAPTRDRRADGAADRARIARETSDSPQVPPPFVRLLQHQLRPLEPVAAHPARGALQHAAPVVEEPADPDREPYLGEPRPVVVDPAFLDRVPHADQQHFRTGGVDPLEHAVVLVLIVVAVVIADDAQARELPDEVLSGALDDVAAGAEQEVAIAALHRVDEEERHEVRAD